LGNFLADISKNNEEDQLQGLVEAIIDLMKTHYKEERIIVPLYKTVDFLIER